MNEQSQPATNDSWDEIYRVIGDGTASEVLALACPTCGGNLRVYFYPGDKTITFPTRLQFAAINIDCTQCGDGARYDGCDVHPPWILELGTKITTRPA